MSNRDNQLPLNDNKGKEAGAGCINAQDFRQNHSSQRAPPPLPHELTAEWTVKAQLKFARAGETVEKKFSSSDTVNPVHVSYKWTTVDENSTTSGLPQHEDTRLQDPLRSTKHSETQKEGSFRSTTSSFTCGGNIGGSDSTFGCSNNSNNQKQQNTLNAEVNKLETHFYGTRCRSTCNITVTAVADFLSPSDIQTLDSATVQNQANDSESFVFNTTADYTVQPEKSSNSGEGKHLNQRDAVCQTSDTEANRGVQYERKRSPLQRKDSRRSYNYRRTAADELLQKTGFRSRVNEENSFVPSQIPSTIQTSKSFSTPHAASGLNLNEDCFPTFVTAGKPSHSDSQKKPRTVHIDVYCTGSDDDDQADAELSSDSDKDDKILDQESNSTFQTVLENEQMRLRHQRQTGNSLPRRLVNNNTANFSNQVSDDSNNINIGHALTKSSTAEEVQESKQLLFRKHIGDQRAVKLQNLRQKYLRQSSEDTLSFGYPNSSRSTVRDNACSSISSFVAGQDVADTSCKESGEAEDLPYSLTKSDSFEYENALDRLRIRQMERLWSRSLSNEDECKSQVAFKRISPNISDVIQEEENLPTKSEIVSETDRSSYHSNDADRKSPNIPTTDDTANYKFQQTSHFALNKTGFLQFFGPHLEHSQPIDERQCVSVKPNDSSLLFPNYEPGLQRWKSETRENLSASATPLLTPSDLSRQASPQPLLPQTSSFHKNFQRSGSEAPILSSNEISTPTPARRFDMYNRSSPAISEASTQPPLFGYSLEYLDKAKLFGKVVAARKPGHHVGPTKNPNCSCESCQRWLADRFQIRSRNFSLGEMPVLKRPA